MVESARGTWIDDREIKEKWKLREIINWLEVRYTEFEEEEKEKKNAGLGESWGTQMYYTFCAQRHRGDLNSNFSS